MKRSMVALMGVAVFWMKLAALGSRAADGGDEARGVATVEVGVQAGQRELVEVFGEAAVDGAGKVLCHTAYLKYRLTNGDLEYESFLANTPEEMFEWLVDRELPADLDRILEMWTNGWKHQQRDPRQ